MTSDGARQNAHMTEAEEVAATDEIVYTRGVSSEVRGRESDEIVGHVGLLDCDSCPAFAAHRAAEEMVGLTAVYQSSPGSYHLWSLLPRSLDESMLWALDWVLADPEHIQQSRRRGCWVLRVAPKVRESGETYREAPTLTAVYDDGRGPVSSAHLSLVRAHSADCSVRVPEVDSARRVGGSSLTTHSYMSLTDRGKELMR